MPAPVLRLRKLQFAQLPVNGGHLMTLGHCLNATIRDMLCEEAGSSAIEYAIMASVMGLMLVPIVAYLSSSIQISYDRLLGWF